MLKEISLWLNGYVDTSTLRYFKYSNPTFINETFLLYHFLVAAFIIISLLNKYDYYAVDLGTYLISLQTHPMGI